MHLQPIVDLNTGLTSGFESLIRWVHPTIGTIRPDYFIDFAERSGQIRDIDLYMIRQVSQLIRVFKDRFQRRVPISVNVSASLLSRSDWLNQIDGSIFSEGLNIEVTERGLVADVAVASATLRTLQELGSKIYIDDFGTGYSSLRYLQELPLDVIKIDRSFVDSITESDKSESLVTLLVSLGQSMNVDLIAEGIEDRAQLELLKQLNVRLGQGYFFSRPIPVDEALNRIELEESSSTES